MTSPVNHLLRLPTSSCGTDALAIATGTGSIVRSLPSQRMVNAAADEIYKRWLPHVGEVAALEEANAFARRFHILIGGQLAQLPVRHSQQ